MSNRTAAWLKLLVGGAILLGSSSGNCFSQALRDAADGLDSPQSLDDVEDWDDFEDWWDNQWDD